ncbi:EamA family transporter [Nakamurella panacisegetis]|uniref:EamA family transporter n=1 Tax=Nakamurella panacisegetis TaxID=1090615 RepID=UPI0018D2FF11|nr:EamA family transporter [Nakamurella panacisegetis]
MKIPAPALAISAMLSVQLGSALSTQLFQALTPAGTAWLRLTVAGAVLLVLARPPLFRLPWLLLRNTLGLGVVTGLLMLMFIEAIARIPLGTAVAIEFLGPLSVAALRCHRQSALLWPALALGGVLGLTQPWVGHLDLVGCGFAVASGISWGGYILLTQRVGSQLPGMQGLAISLGTAAVTLAPCGLMAAISGLTVPIALQGIGVAILVPLLPFAFEMLALRRMRVAAFGTLMALEPAIATVLGLVILTQRPDLLQLVGVAAVVVAGIGAQRSAPAPVPDDGTALSRSSRSDVGSIRPAASGQR